MTDAIVDAIQEEILRHVKPEVVVAAPPPVPSFNQSFVSMWNAIHEAGGGRIFLADELLACPQDAVGLKWGVLRVQVAMLQKEWLAKNGYIGKETDIAVNQVIVSEFNKKVKPQEAGRF